MQIIDPQKARISCHTKQFFQFYFKFHNIKLDWEIENMQVVIYKLILIYAYIFQINVSYLLSLKLTWTVKISASIDWLKSPMQLKTFLNFFLQNLNRYVFLDGYKTISVAEHPNPRDHPCLSHMWCPP